MLLTRLLLSCLLLISLKSLAIGSQKFDNYSVEYTTFPSTLIDAKIAGVYGIKRSKYETLVNVVIYKEGVKGGQKVNIKGYAKNLMAKQQKLKFLEIQEENTVYYIAPIRVANEDTMHINFDISLPDNSQSFAVKFTKKLYVD